MSPNKLFDVLDAIAVRQTRRFVKRFYLNEKIRRGDAWVTITFPQPSVLREDYDLDDVLPGFSQRFAHALGANVEAEDSPLPSPDDFDYGEQLTLARYAPSAYWIGGDSSNMQPAIPKSMRDTAELLTAHRPNDLEDSRWRRLLDTIEAPYDTRTQQMVRKTLDAHEDVKERVAAIIALIDDLGLEPPPEVEPLPEIEEEDVNLVTWMAPVPSENSTQR